jgi:agmatinase
MIDADTAFMNFGGRDVPPADLADARVAVLPLCYEQGASYGTGSAEGSYHLLAASDQLERMDEETFTDWGRIPIHTLPPLFPDPDPEQAVAQMADAAAYALGGGRRLLSLGGDHAVSIGPIAAAARQYPGVGVLQIDAHLDLRDEWNGSRLNHACVMRRVTAGGNVPVVPVGIRSFSPEEYAAVRRRGLTPFWMHTLGGGVDWIPAVIAALPRRVYLSIDLDGLDPAVLPGTGTPEPGGLSYRQLTALIRALGEQREVVAADITELVKIPGSQVSEFTAAKIATKILVHCWGR